MPKFNLELQRMEELDFIKKVEQPTDTCAGIVMVPNSYGSFWICVDLTRLNVSVRRERHVLTAVDASSRSVIWWEGLYKIGSKCQIMADKACWQFCLIYNIYHAFWKVLFSKIYFQYHFGYEIFYVFYSC